MKTIIISTLLILGSFFAAQAQSNYKHPNYKPKNKQVVAQDAKREADHTFEVSVGNYQKARNYKHANVQTNLETVGGLLPVDAENPGGVSYKHPNRKLKSVRNIPTPANDKQTSQDLSK
jgi:hypothetical protein